jgi:hypothetical protein
MSPPTEQLIRDYLNRVSVAARGRLSAEDRRGFLARTREFIEQNTRAVGHTDSADVRKLLSELGDPAALVDRERDRLAAPGAGPDAGEPGGGSRTTRALRWRPGRGTLASLMTAPAAPVAPGAAGPVPEPAEDAPLTGELRFQTRPISSRWRPGAPMVPKGPRQRRAGIPRRLQPEDQGPGEGQEPPTAGGRPGGGAPGQGAAGQGARDQQATGSASPADARRRPRRPEWPSLASSRPEAAGTGPASGEAQGDGNPHSNGHAGPSQAGGPDAGGPDASGPDAGRSAASGAQRDAGAPANGHAPMYGPTANGMPANGRPASDLPASGGPAGGASASAPAAGGLRPGDAPSGDAPSGNALDGRGSADTVLDGREPAGRVPPRAVPGAGWASGVRARGARLGRTRGGGASQQGPGQQGPGQPGGQRGAGLRGEKRAGGSQPGAELPDDPLAAFGASAARVASAVVSRARRRPLEATAVVLLGLGGLIFPPVWLMGAAVALISKVWDFRDKWIGLALPVFAVIVGMVADVSLGSTQPSFSHYVREAWIFGGHMSRIAAVLGAVYLAWRAEHGRRAPAVPPWNKSHRFG